MRGRATRWLRAPLHPQVLLGRGDSHQHREGHDRGQDSQPQHHGDGAPAPEPLRVAVHERQRQQQREEGQLAVQDALETEPVLEREHPPEAPRRPSHLDALDRALPDAGGPDHRDDAEHAQQNEPERRDPAQVVGEGLGRLTGRRLVAGLVGGQRRVRGDLVPLDEQRVQRGEHDDEPGDDDDVRGVQPHQDRDPVGEVRGEPQAGPAQELADLEVVERGPALKD